MSIPPRAWLDPRLDVRPSPIEGVGLFATAPIHAGEVVLIWGGRPIDDEVLRALEVRWRERDLLLHRCPIGESLNLL